MSLAEVMDHAWFGDVHHFDDIDILPSLAGVLCPSLVIAGQDDFICGPAWNQPIAAAIPAARYVEIADSGHLPQYEQPGAFGAALVARAQAGTTTRPAAVMAASGSWSSPPWSSPRSQSPW